MSLNLNYYCGQEAEQFTFYRIPKLLMTDEHYQVVSMEAKMLYGLMLDRMSLSQRNNWLDQAGHVYIFFTLEDAIQMTKFSKNKVVKLFKELDEIGLIERKKQGQGRPAIIYVKNFVLPINPEEPGEMLSNMPKPPASAVEMPRSSRSESKLEVQTSQKQTSGIGSSKILSSESEDVCPEMQITDETPAPIVETEGLSVQISAEEQSPDTQDMRLDAHSSLIPSSDGEQSTPPEIQTSRIQTQIILRGKKLRRARLIFLSPPPCRRALALRIGLIRWMIAEPS